MSSLQEQLLKAGLVDANNLKQAAKEKNKKGKQVRNSKGKSARNKAPAVKTDAQKRREQQVWTESAKNNFSKRQHRPSRNSLFPKRHE